MAQTAFRPCDKVDGAPCKAPFVEFDVCVACVGGATWSGPDDHSTAIAMSWTPGTLYAGINVRDDSHQNPGSGWNGDTVQIMFTNAARPQGATAKTGEIATDAGMILYNYGLSDSGDYTLHHESHPCLDECTGAAMVRFGSLATTIYEISFPAHSLGLESFQSGFRFGLGICVNDGDSDGTGAGQAGWSGWAPYGIVHGGKQAENNGLARLTGTFVPGAAIAAWAPVTNAAVSCADLRDQVPSCALGR
jgi:hypothetical protein